jgi:hypothetical protein
MRKLSIAVLLLCALSSVAHASITFVNSTTYENPGAPASSITLAVPTGTVNNDVMIACIGWSIGSVTTITPPAGWTLLQTVTVSSSLNIQASCYSRLAASESSPYTWTFGAATGQAGFILDYRGAVTTGFVDASAITSGAGTTISAPSVTTTSANDYVIMAFLSSTRFNGSSPIGTTQRALVPSSYGPNMMGVDFLQSVAGVTGTRTVANLSNNWIGATIALIPSFAPPTPPGNVTVAGGINNFYGKACIACHVDIYPLNPTGLSNLGSGGTLIETNPVTVETNGAGIFSASVVGSVTAALYVEETNALLKFTLPSSGTLTLAQILAQQPNVVSAFPPSSNLNMGGQRFINLSGGQAVGDSAAVGEGLEAGCQDISESGNYPIPTGATYAELLLIGAGGGGGGGATGASNGGGGGGDGTTERCLMFPGNGEITFTIGAAGMGGAAATAGTDGQETEAAQGVATCVAPGGNHGTAGSGGGTGTGGAASSAGSVTGAAKQLYETVGVAGSNGTSGAGGAGAGSSQFGGAGGNPSSGVGSNGDAGSAVLCAY